MSFVIVVSITFALVAPWATKSVFDAAGPLASWGWVATFVAAHIWVWKCISYAISNGASEIIYMPAIMLAVYELIVIGFVPMTFEDEDTCRCLTCEQHRHKAVKKG
ncbi:MAG: hypothetical protein ACFNUS_00300 [Candidatus Saccharimonas sp.]